MKMLLSKLFWLSIVKAVIFATAFLWGFTAFGMFVAWSVNIAPELLPLMRIFWASAFVTRFVFAIAEEPTP